MKFNDWLDSKLTVVDDVRYLEASGNDFCNTTLNTVKKIYNLFKDTNILDFLDIVYDEKSPSMFKYYIVLTNNIIFMDGMIDIIRYFNSKEIVSRMTEEELKSRLIINMDDINLDGKFYCLLSLDPHHFLPDYIAEVEDYLNKDITQYTDISTLFKNFMHKFETDNLFNATVLNSFNYFAILCFRSEQNLNNYKKMVRNKKDISNMINNVIQVSSIDELKQLLGDEAVDNILPSNNSNNNKLLS